MIRRKNLPVVETDVDAINYRTHDENGKEDQRESNSRNCRHLLRHKVDQTQRYENQRYQSQPKRNFDAAEASARQAQKLDTAHRWPKTDHVLGAILYAKKDFTGAAEQLRNYLTFAPDATDADQVKAQLAEIEKLSGDAKAKAERPEQ